MKGNGMNSVAADHFIDIEQFEAGLWKIADDLRANSGLASNEYFMPIMGLLFLRQASNRLCLPFISSGVHQERRPVRRHW